MELRYIGLRVDFHSVEENLRHSFRIFAGSRQSGEVREALGVTIASAGVSFQMFNAAFLSAPVTNEMQMETRIATARVHFDARGLGWAYWICEDWLDPKLRRRGDDILRKHRLYLAAEMPGMAAQGLVRPMRTLPKLEMRPVSDAQTEKAFCDIGALCFNVPPQWFREIFEDPKVWRSGFDGYVGYLDGEPVSTAATVIGAGVAGVYNVATAPAYQRRGFGEAIMRYALGRAREQTGIERTVLQSTPQGLDLYRRMGYSVVTNLQVYNS